MTNISLFSQILGLVDRQVFNKVVRKHDADKHHKGFNTWTHLVSMLFCHLAKAAGVRDISNGLRSATGNLNHLGVGMAPSKSILSYQNKHRSWEVFRDLYFALLEQMEAQVQRRRLYARRLRRKIFIVDATVVTLCVSLFDWARFRQRKGAIKLHTVLDYDLSLPVFLHMTDGRQHEMTVARQLDPPCGSVIIMDKAYVDFAWLSVLDSRGVFFVTRMKDNTLFRIVCHHPVLEKDQHIMHDVTVCMTGTKTAKKYPGHLRVVSVYDEHKQENLLLLTNNTSWTADTVSQLYKARWDIETFFKAIKQTLKIKTFIGTSPNAILIQVWTAMISILLLKYLQNRAKYGWHLSNLVGFLRINLFVKIDLWGWINEPFIRPHDPPEQLTLL